MLDTAINDVIDEELVVNNEESPEEYPGVLYLLAMSAIFLHGLIFLVALIFAVIDPGIEFVDYYFLEINILRNPTILPLGVYSPLVALSGYGLLYKKSWGLLLYLFFHAMNLAAIGILILKYPAYIALTKIAYLPMIGCYGFLLISMILLFYLCSKTVLRYFGLELKFVLKRFAVYLVVAFVLTFIIAFFADSVFGLNALKNGYVNPGWLK
jgi:hypothetical protein